MQFRMKKPILILALTLVALTLLGQGTLTPLIDQQSAPDAGNSSGMMPGVGQSFTPAFSSIDFVQMVIYVGVATPVTNASIFINLRSDSIGGPVIGTTALTPVPAFWSFGSFTTFL